MVYVYIWFFLGRGGGLLEYSLAAVEPFNCQGRGDESDGEGTEWARAHEKERFLTTTESFDFVGPPHAKDFAIEKGEEMAKEVRTVWW